MKVSPSPLVEAMAAGLPSVATDVDGNCEAIGEDEAGIAVEPRDPAALVAALTTLIEDEGLRQRLGRRARQRVAELFDVQAMVRNYEEIYRFCLEGNAGDRPLA